MSAAHCCHSLKLRFQGSVCDLLDTDHWPSLVAVAAAAENAAAEELLDTEDAAAAAAADGAESAPAEEPGSVDDSVAVAD